MATQCATSRASVAHHRVNDRAANGCQPPGGSDLPASASLQRVDTPLGPFDAIWSATGLWAFAFARPEQSLTAGDRMQSKLQQACDRYFQTGHFDWDLEWLDWSGVSAFHRRVLRACHLIPTGSVLTYGELAAQVGSPLSARAVGGAMARNRWPLIIPCHRVVGASGRLTGYSGVGGLETKRRLLELEQTAL